jgi:hypothetical protein
MIDPSQWERWLSSDGFTVVKIPSQALWESMTFNAVQGEPVETIAAGTIPISGFFVNEGMFRHLVAQGKHYPRPRRCRSKARMARKWRDRA